MIKNKINFIRQYKFKDCKNKRSLIFDFYLPEYNICIEYQGGQHYERFRFEKDDTNLKKRIYRDQIKRNYCKQKGIELIEIKYTDAIEEKLKKII